MTERIDMVILTFVDAHMDARGQEHTREYPLDLLARDPYACQQVLMGVLRTQYESAGLVLLDRIEVFSTERLR